MSRILATALIALALLSPDGRAATVESVERVLAERNDDDGRGTPYVVDKKDNICGLNEPKQLSNPAKVDYDELLSATPEVLRMKKEKIDKDSAEGIQLLNQAESRVLKACQAVREAEGHCSVWKDIKRREGQKIPDLTSKVKKEIGKKQD